MRYELSDFEWAANKPLLPTNREAFRRLRDSGDDAVVQTIRFGCQVLIFADELGEFVSASRKPS